MAAVMKSSMNQSFCVLRSEAVPEGARRASEGMPRSAAPPDPEVVAIARRRQFSASEKRRCWPRPIAARQRHARRVPAQQAHLFLDALELAQAAGCGRSAWRSLPRSAGPSPIPRPGRSSSSTATIARLRRKLERAELIIDAQKKLCVALGLPTADDRSEDE